MPASALRLRPPQPAAASANKRRGHLTFVTHDRVIWRNRRGRLCHGIVQGGAGDVLFVAESFSVEPRKAASTFDDAFFQPRDKNDWEVVKRGDVVRKANI